jgi:type II secretory pathway component PulK
VSVALHRRRGFVLVSVLWVIVALSVMSATAVLETRGRMLAAGHRVASDVTEWHLLACASEHVARIQEAMLVDDEEQERRRLWRRLDRGVPPDTRFYGTRCALRLDAEGTSLNVNGVTAARMTAFFTAHGLGNRVDLVDALLDWMDEDTLPRGGGAERAWYRMNGRIPPRDGRIQHQHELRLIRGFEDLAADVLAELSVGDGRIFLQAAPRAVLATIPGLSADGISRLQQERQSSTLDDISELEQVVGPRDAEAVRENFPAIVSLATVDPEAWILRVEAEGTSGGAASGLELRLIRSPAGAAITWQRVW